MSQELMYAALAQRMPLANINDLDALRDDIAEILAAHPEVQLVVFPEMHLQNAAHLDPAAADELLESVAVPLESELVQKLGQIAAEFNIWLVPGSIGEKASSGYFNTELLFSPQGKLIASYRKMFPWRPSEPHDLGTAFVVAPLAEDGEQFIAGLSNCYDSWFPEHTRHLAWFGADVILNVVKTTSQDREQELILAQANAIANQVYFLSVNCAEPLGRGKSIAVDPEGQVLALAGTEEQTLIVALDPKKLATVRQSGTCGTNRMWQQFRDTDPNIPLPLYNGAIVPQHWTPKNHKQYRTEE